MNGENSVAVRDAAMYYKGKYYKASITIIEVKKVGGS